MNRRTFFLGGAFAAAALASDQVVVGLIGAGARGMQLLRECLTHPSVRIGAVCETYEPRMFGAGALARSKGHHTRYYRVYSDLIADTDVDAVIIATPDFWHHRMTREALRAGKDVYVEQPLCLTWEQGVDLLRAEAESRKIVQVGSQRRSSPLFIEAAREIAAGPVGRIQMLRAHRSSSYLHAHVLRRGGVKLPEPLNFQDWQAAAATKVDYSPDRFLNWRFYADYGGGAVTDLGCHAVDGLNMLTGLSYPVSVKAGGALPEAEGFDVPANASIIVEYGDRQVAAVSVDAAVEVPPREQELSAVDGAGGRLEITPYGYRSWDAGAAVPAVQRSLLNGPEEATRRHLATFLEAVRSRNPANAPIRVTFPSTLICQMANLSIRSGATVRWNAADRKVEA